MKLIAFITAAYGWLIRIASSLQSVLLLVIRLYWGYAFTQTGWGKLMNHSKPAEYFASLGIPFPDLNAWLAGGVECFGGVLLLVGLASRAVALPLIFTMIVAYITTEQEALQEIGGFITGFGTFLKDISNLPDLPGKFATATPFLFLFAAVIVLVFGPGKISIDYLLARKFGAGRDSNAATPFSRQAA